MPAKKSNKAKDIKSLLSELESIVAWFESEDVDISQALVKYEAGLKTIQQLEQQLKHAKVEVEKIEKRFDN